MFRPNLSQSSSGSRIMERSSLVKEEIVEQCRICETMENLVDISTEPYSHLNEKLHRLANFEGNCSYLLNFICRPCSLQLEKAFDFKSRCENTYKKIISKMIINTVDPLEDTPQQNTKCPTMDYLEDMKRENKSFEEDEDSDDSPDMEEEENVVKRSRKKTIVNPERPKRGRGGTHHRKKLPDNIDFEIDKIRKWVCAICGKAFQEKWIMTNHIKGLHITEKPYSCDLCDSKFALQAALKRHKVTHGDFKLPCDICGKKFKNLLYMKKHIKQVHSKPPRPNAGSLVCQTCGHLAKNRSTLVAHLRIHTGSKSYTCEVCSKSFRRKQQLKVHSSTHTGERSFLCHLCSKSFRLSAHLKIHLDTHKGIRKHKCHFCEKSYSQTYSLKLHIKNEHTGEPRYECPKCLQKFRDRKVRTSHAMSCSGQPTKEDAAAATETITQSGGGTTVIVNSNQIIPSMPAIHYTTTGAEYST